MARARVRRTTGSPFELMLTSSLARRLESTRWAVSVKIPLRWATNSEAVFWQFQTFAIASEKGSTLLHRQQLVAIVRKRLRSPNGDVARSQFRHEIRKGAHLELPPVHADLPFDLLQNQFLPAIGGESQVYLIRFKVTRPPGGVVENHSDSVQQPVIGGGCL
jgi:hypothetical protein